MKNNISYPVVIPAAGIGSRMAASTAKQYLKLGDKSILEHTIDVFLAHPKISNIVLVLHPQDNLFKSLSIATHPKIDTVIGGDERVDSVLAGLQFLAQQAEHDWVLVHDAARPCLCQQDITQLIEQSVQTQGGILAVRVIDTIKQAQKNTNVVDKTIDRTHLWQAQTPQMFPLALLIACIQKGLTNNATITDEASAIEYCQHSVSLIEGKPSNIKITRPCDMALANYYLSIRD